MERHSTTAVLLYCRSCGLMCISDNYAAAHARGAAYTSVSRHSNLQYTLIEAPDPSKERHSRGTAESEAGRGYVEEVG